MKLDENIYKTTVVFLMLFSITEENHGKIPHKKIIRSIKKYLAEQRTKYGRDYLRMVNIASDSLKIIASKMVVESSGSTLVHVSPAKLLHLFYKIDPELFKLWCISDEVLDEYRKYYENDKLLFPTLMYYNRICSTYEELANA